MPTPPQSSAPSRRDPALDGLRGLAVLLVFLFHYGGGLRAHNPLLRAFGYLTQAGWIGVDVFFALSGFLITGILAATLLCERPKPLRDFYLRRALRILPVYLAALFACAAAALLSGSKLAACRPLLVYAAFLQNLPPFLNAALHTPPPLPVFHLWSLAVEEQFYLLWPLALLAARTRQRAFRLSLYTVAASCLFRLLVFAPHLLPWATAASFATFLPTRAGALALGSALALHRSRSIPTKSMLSPPERKVRSGQTPIFRDASVPGTSIRPTILLAAALLSLVLILIAGLHTHTLLLNNRLGFLVTLPGVDLLSATVVALSLSANPLRATLSTRPLALLGRISYGFYVLHILLEPAFDRLGALITHTDAGFGYQAARLLVAFPLTAAAAWLSFTYFEQPFLRHKRRYPQGGEAAP